MVHEPGTDFVYGIQYDVLGRLLEVVGGIPLDELFREKMFEPLCMYDLTPTPWLYLCRWPWLLLLR